MAERAITLLTRVVTDVPMVGILAWNSDVKGVLVAFAVITPIYVLLCLGIVAASDAAHRMGIDVTGLETLRELEDKTLEKKQKFSRFVQWILKSKKLIFWVGSWFYLDPDYVTLLLRNKEDRYLVTTLKITLPSVIISMVVWLGVYWASVKGFHLATWALERVL